MSGSPHSARESGGEAHRNPNIVVTSQHCSWCAGQPASQPTSKCKSAALGRPEDGEARADAALRKREDWGFPLTVAGQRSRRGMAWHGVVCHASCHVYSRGQANMGGRAGKQPSCLRAHLPPATIWETPSHTQPETTETTGESALQVGGRSAVRVDGVDEAWRAGVALWAHKQGHGPCRMRHWGKLCARRHVQRCSIAHLQS